MGIGLRRGAKENGRIFIIFSPLFLIFVLTLIIDRKTFIIFRSLFLFNVNKSFSPLGFRFSLPTNPLKSLFFADPDAEADVIVELSSSLLNFFLCRPENGNETINIELSKKIIILRESPISITFLYVLEQWGEFLYYVTLIFPMQDFKLFIKKNQSRRRKLI